MIVFQITGISTLQYSLNTEVKVASLFYKGLTDLFAYLTKIYSTYYFTLKSTNTRGI